jgi:4-hydroxybenzoate polyprenyltransferase
MLGIQFSIGALNDFVDADQDSLVKPRKPIPAGLVTRGVALAVAGAGAVAGLGLSAVSGPATLIVGACCLGLGWLYDLRLSRTRLSWLPLALALPLLPIHAWLGAAGTVPPALVGLLPIGVTAGAGLALANGLVDIERDAGTRRSAGVVRLGPRRAWLTQTVLLVVAAALVVVLAPGGWAFGGATTPILGSVRSVALVLGCVVLVLGAATLGSERAAIRERGWELEAFGVAGLGIGWLAGTSSLGGG